MNFPLKYVGIAGLQELHLAVPTDPDLIGLLAGRIVAPCSVYLETGHDRYRKP